jgi:hypothetical protein
VRYVYWSIVLLSISCGKIKIKVPESDIINPVPEVENTGNGTFNLEGTVTKVIDGFFPSAYAAEDDLLSLRCSVAQGCELISQNDLVSEIKNKYSPTDSEKSSIIQEYLANRDRLKKLLQNCQNFKNNPAVNGLINVHSTDQPILSAISAPEIIHAISTNSLSCGSIDGYNDFESLKSAFILKAFNNDPAILGLDSNIESEEPDEIYDNKDLVLKNFEKIARLTLDPLDVKNSIDKLSDILIYFKIIDKRISNSENGFCALIKISPSENSIKEISFTPIDDNGTYSFSLKSEERKQDINIKINCLKFDNGKLRSRMIVNNMLNLGVNKQGVSNLNIDPITTLVSNAMEVFFGINPLENSLKSEDESNNTNEENLKSPFNDIQKVISQMPGAKNTVYSEKTSEEIIEDYLTKNNPNLLASSIQFCVQSVVNNAFLSSLSNDKEDTKKEENKDEDQVLSKLGIKDADFPTGCLLASASDENSDDNAKGDDLDNEEIKGK